MRTRIAVALALLLSLTAAGCGGSTGSDDGAVAVEPAAGAAGESGESGASSADASSAGSDAPAEGGEAAGGDKPDPRGELSVGDDKEQVGLQVEPAADGGEVAAVPAAADGRLCDQLPTARVREVLGGEAGVQDVTPDTCTYTLVEGSEVTIASITRVEAPPEGVFETLVQTQAESLDADMVAEPMDDLGDQAYALVGELGTYLHVLAGELYLITYVDGPLNAMAAAESLTRLALGG